VRATNDEDEKLQGGKAAQLHQMNLATLPLCNHATLLFSHQATCLPAPITMKIER
jgi:hypothetical protein